MNTPFTEALRKLRTEKGLSQRQLGNLLFTYRSTIARWENGSRLPDVIMIPRLAKCLGTDVSTLYHRAIFSTYPTIMNAINDETTDDGQKLFTPGHFDLIIIDNSYLLCIHH